MKRKEGIKKEKAKKEIKEENFVPMMGRRSVKDMKIKKKKCL